MYFVAHDLQRPKQIAGASQTQEKHRGAAVSRHAFSINPKYVQLVTLQLNMAEDRVVISWKVVLDAG